jgi:hypothetical protein
LVSFSASDASDLDHYEIYADTIPFEEVGAREPAMIVNRDGSQQGQDGFGGGPGGGRQGDTVGNEDIQDLILTRLSNGQNIVPGVMIWVAVVTVDSSDNAWRNNLNVGKASAVDDSLLDPGLHLPQVEGLQASWDEEGTIITVTWTESSDAQVRGYIVHLSSELFEDVRYAEYHLDLIQGTSQTIKASDFDPALDSNGTWYVAVVASDGEVTRFGVTPVTVDEWDPNNVNSNVEIDEEGSSEWWDNMNAMEMALMAVLTLMIILLSMVIIGRLRKSNYDPMDHATPNWELQVDDWDEGNHTPTMKPEVDFEDTLMPAVTAIRETTPQPSRRTPTTVPDEDLESLAGDLLGDSQNKDSADPFGLDDLLDEI